RARPWEKRGYRYSYDMLGEAAYTDADAIGYFQTYLDAIRVVGLASKGQGCIRSAGVSVKLSALYPRYEFAKAAHVHQVLYPRLLQLAQAAAQANIGLCVDAEEVDRLEISLDIIEQLAFEPSLKDWQGLGLAVQAYQRRSRAVVDWLVDLAERSGHRLMIRLVKGAYWDTEIKRAQEAGLATFPVFTRKLHTDIAYLACARSLIDAGMSIYPCFASHNAQTVAWILAYADQQQHREFEFQRLHGMGEPLYVQVSERGEWRPATRIYAPVGGHEHLLAYLVRRLLENGANSSFVNRMVDDALPIGELVRDPIEQASHHDYAPHPDIVQPLDVFWPRINSKGLDLTDPLVLQAVQHRLQVIKPNRLAQPIIGGKALAGQRVALLHPADTTQQVGEVIEATAEQALQALRLAVAAQPSWEALGVERRAMILEKAADLFEQQRIMLMQLCVEEAGKTWKDAVAEIREAVDFLRYYAREARRLFDLPLRLPAPTGEDNQMVLRGRGAWLCISPWNFPLAIFVGQIAAALAAGNTVLAKPAEQTPLVAAAAVRLLHEAGVRGDELHLLTGDGARLGKAIMAAPNLAGVVFTGSTEVAKLINQQLAARDGAIVPLIAETGGLNCMIVDSSALPEQVTRDVLASAFQSAGQRCSALRVLYLQDEIYDRQMAMIQGALAELKVGLPTHLDTDLSAVIDQEAQQGLLAHIETFRAQHKLIDQLALPTDLPAGHWVTPTILEVSGIEALNQESFGPILHVARYSVEKIDQVVDAINQKGYGLTLAVHSRIEMRWRRIARRARVGNIYINRNQIGAIVGSQPFGGQGLSGTGPKAGGPHYLLRFATEHCISADLTAAGGDTRLMGLSDT
ncbi:MAG: bifunctional proline dehydrogenase/L-glutamate gamma-semialdehyde dehydrogenase PutA, partial [Pseudomonadota bacterium]|nr:bifunctional proline dehydrogenase/L-glutamate gamma-semialdehyde dehydrogenase PutA [Pseudomonadota bacterium]